MLHVGADLHKKHISLCVVERAQAMVEILEPFRMCVKTDSTP